MIYKNKVGKVHMNSVAMCSDFRGMFQFSGVSKPAPRNHCKGRQKVLIFHVMHIFFFLVSCTIFLYHLFVSLHRVELITVTSMKTNLSIKEYFYDFAETNPLQIY